MISFSYVLKTNDEKKNKNIWKKNTKQNKKIKNKMWIKNDKYLNITKKKLVLLFEGKLMGIILKKL